MTLTEWMKSNRITGVELANTLGCAPAYVSRIRSGDRPLSLEKAIAIFNRYKAQLGPLEGATPAEIRALTRLVAKRAA